MEFAQNIWKLFMSDPISFLTAVVIALGISWAARGFFHRTTVESLTQQLNLARSQAKEFERQFIRAEAQLSELKKQIERHAPADQISATVFQTGTVFADLRTANTVLQSTLAPLPSRLSWLTKGTTEPSE